MQAVREAESRFGWPVSEDDGIRHDWDAVTKAEEAVVAELRKAGWVSTADVFREVAKRVRLEDHEVRLAAGKTGSRTVTLNALEVVQDPGLRRLILLTVTGIGDTA